MRVGSGDPRSVYAEQVSEFTNAEDVVAKFMRAGTGGRGNDNRRTTADAARHTARFNASRLDLG